MGQVGPKENSGFVTNTETEPLTTTLGERWHYRSRPTGPTEYKDKFPQYDYPKVNLFIFIISKQEFHFFVG